MTATSPAHDEPAPTTGGLVHTVAQQLGSEAEARWIVAHAVGLAPSRLAAAPDAPVPSTAVRSVQVMVQRRRGGEPVQYVLGEWSFRRLEVDVDSRVLVPRPETEQVVELALDELRHIAADRRAGDRPAGDGRLAVADLGTGSGVIALSFALEGGPAVDGDAPVSATGPAPGASSDVEVWATDVSAAALAVAAANVARLARTHPGAAARVRLSEGSWFDALPGHLAGRLHLVVSNPPYVSAAEWSALDPVVRDHEPRDALVPGEAGVEALDLLLDQARRWLRPGGGIVLELAPHQAARVATAATAFGYHDVRIRRDLADRDRMVMARWPGG